MHRNETTQEKTLFFTAVRWWPIRLDQPEMNETHPKNGPDETCSKTYWENRDLRSILTWELIEQGESWINYLQKTNEGKEVHGNEEIIPIALYPDRSVIYRDYDKSLSEIRINYRTALKNLLRIVRQQKRIQINYTWQLSNELRLLAVRIADISARMRSDGAEEGAVPLMEALEDVSQKLFSTIEKIMAELNDPAQDKFRTFTCDSPEHPKERCMICTFLDKQNQ